MKRAGYLMEQIATRDNLRLALGRAAQGRRRRSSNLAPTGREVEAWISQLRADLLGGDVRVGAFQRFVIHDPKRRVIHAASFRERVLHHAILAVAGPAFERLAIDDSFACRPGKGVHRARMRAQQFGRRYKWYLKLDVRRYFDSIKHQILEQQLCRLFKDPELLHLFSRIIRSYETETGQGVPIGSLTSQYFANAYLSPLDRFIKQELRCRGYLRYMDDLLLLHESADQLPVIQGRVIEFASKELALELRNKGKHQVGYSQDGIPFLGTRVTPFAIYPQRAGRRRMLRQLRRAEARFTVGSIDEDTLIRQACSLLAALEQTRCATWRRRMLTCSLED